MNDRVKRGEEWTDAAYYFDVTVWGRTAENCAQYLAKGRPVGVQGKLTWREWDAQDGSKRQSVEVVADNVQFLGAVAKTAAVRASSSCLPARSAGLVRRLPCRGRADDDIPF